MSELLGDTLFAELTLGLGLALMVGNGYAWYKASRGERPDEIEGEFRRGRVVFLILIGMIMSIWGALSF